MQKKSEKKTKPTVSTSWQNTALKESLDSLPNTLKIHQTYAHPDAHFESILPVHFDDILQHRAIC